MCFSCEMAPAQTPRTQSLTQEPYITSEHVCASSLLIVRMLIFSVLTKYIPKLKVRKEKNLLKSKAEDGAVDEAEEVRVVCLSRRFDTKASSGGRYSIALA